MPVTYIHQHPEWPNFTWSDKKLSDQLAAVRHRQGRLVGHMEALGFELRDAATLLTLTQDVVKSSEIEGEILQAQQVRSSIARRLGMDVGGLTSSDRHVDGIVDMVLDATRNHTQPLTKDRLFDWHAALFPAGRSGMRRITVADWRTDANGPMHIVSGPIGRERVHFEAPKASRLDTEMATFLDWFENGPALDPVLKAGIAHLWFVTVHPFDDGNGRMARAIADLMLARSEGSMQRFYSMSASIRVERDSYYDKLESTQKGGLDITAWLQWFLTCLDHSFNQAEETLTNVLDRARFWEKHAGENLNDRQRLMLTRLLDDFEGKLTSGKWASIAKCSPDTALRDITDLLERGILERDAGGGRSTGYHLTKHEK